MRGGSRSGFGRRCGRLVPALLLTVGCAGGPGPDERSELNELARRAFELSEVQERPELMGCRYQAPPGAERWVVLRYVVDAAGYVEDVTISPVDRDPRATAWHEGRAMDIAASCRYRPARIAGEAVRVWLTEVFRFPAR